MAEIISLANRLRGDCTVVSLHVPTDQCAALNCDPYGAVGVMYAILHLRL